MVPSYAMKLLFVVMLSASLLLIDVEEALACTCLAISPSEAFDRSEFVFSGVSIASSYFYSPYANAFALSETFHNQGEAIYVFKVDTVWKGQPYEYVYLRTAHRSPCIYGFTLGEEYLVYARTVESVASSACSRTGLLVQAREDLEWLGEGQPPESGTWGPGPNITRDWLPADAIIEKLAKSWLDMQYKLWRSRQTETTPTPASITTPTPRAATTPAPTPTDDPPPVREESDTPEWLLPTMSGVAGVLIGVLATTLLVRQRRGGT